VQIAWLIALVPALVVGALFRGIAGVGIAQVCVVLVVVTPMYLWRLSRSGVRARQVLARVWVPVLVGLVVLGMSWTVARYVDNALAADLIAGFLTLGVIALLLFRERATLSSFRSLGKSSVPVEAVPLPLRVVDNGITP
jgi:hypothetical protein